MRGGDTRRRFLQHGAAAGALAGLGDLTFLSKLAPACAAEASLKPPAVKLDAEVEPIVRLLEETPRDRLLEEVAQRIRGGLDYNQLLAGLLLAGVKNIEPRPSVGHKFHAVLVVNSAHLASMGSPAEHRWLPIFWALDYYKDAAQRDADERGDWTMGAVDESRLPSSLQANRAFTEAMDTWDEPAADRAVAALARTAGSSAVSERLFRYGMRDFRDIGHKAIYVANSLRTLQSIGWQHAEPVLRSLAYALLAHEGDSPHQRDAEADRPYRRNLELAEKISADWPGGKPDPAAATELLAALRTATNDEACDLVLEQLNRGVGPQSIWDALHLASAELIMRQSGIVSLHAVTTTNALRYAYLTSANRKTRLLAMLQNAAFLPMFRQSMQGRGALTDAKIDELTPADEVAATAGSAPALDEIFAALGDDRTTAARMALANFQRAGDAASFINAARVLVFLKGDNAHDYKFCSAALEDYYNVSPTLRDKYLAASVFDLRSSQDPDNKLVQRTRSALA